MISLLLAWRPILDPIALPAGSWWITILPLAMGIAMSYKAVRIPERNGWWKLYIRASLIMSVQIVTLIALLALMLHLVVEIFAPGVGTQLHG